MELDQPDRLVGRRLGPLREVFGLGRRGGSRTSSPLLGMLPPPGHCDRLISSSRRENA